MIIQVVIEGTLRNKVIEKDIAESDLVSTISFIKDHGLYESDRWIPTHKIKEIKFTTQVGRKPSRVFYSPQDIDDRLIPEKTS